MGGMNPTPPTRQRRCRSLLPCLLLALAAAPLGATEVYRWVDADGVVHFSDKAPPSGVDDYSRQDVIVEPPAGYDPEQDVYGVAAQQERMRALREDMERRREARRENEAAAPRPPVAAQSPAVSYPLYPYPGWRPRPPRPPRPEPPIEPPVEPRPPTATLKPPGSGRP